MGISAVATGAPLGVYSCALRQIWRRCRRSLPEHRRHTQSKRDDQESRNSTCGRVLAKAFHLCVNRSLHQPSVSSLFPDGESDRKRIALRLCHYPQTWSVQVCGAHHSILDEEDSRKLLLPRLVRYWHVLAGIGLDCSYTRHARCQADGMYKGCAGTGQILNEIGRAACRERA